MNIGESEIPTRPGQYEDIWAATVGAGSPPTRASTGSAALALSASAR